MPFSLALHRLKKRNNDRLPSRFPALAAYLHAVTANLVSVAVRLVPLGQRAGVAVIAALEDAVLAAARRAAGSSLDDLGSAAFVSDIAAMRHETLPVRIFAT